MHCRYMIEGWVYRVIYKVAYCLSCCYIIFRGEDGLWMEILSSDSVSDKDNTLSFLWSIIICSTKCGYVYFIAYSLKVGYNLLFHKSFLYRSKPLDILADYKIGW